MFHFLSCLFITLSDEKNLKYLVNKTSKKIMQMSDRESELTRTFSEKKNHRDNNISFFPWKQDLSP